jgi:CRISPR-associated protein Cmr1
MSYRQLQFTLRFLTPAFLGDAEQNGRWRTPPIKALLRQWWRVRYAKDHGYDHSRVRNEEGDLFGNAWLAPVNGVSRHRKSRVALRLEPWAAGKVSTETWPGGEMESVGTTAAAKGRVRADIYLGFGPVLPPSRKENRPGVTIRTAIGTAKDDSALLTLHPAAEAEKLRDVLQLIVWFGTVGSRSRNGWGSLVLEPQDSTPPFAQLPTADTSLIRDISRPWVQCLDKDWPHALGDANGKPLIWLTPPHKDWRKAMGSLANVRFKIRRIAKGFAGPRGIGGIHLLGYPAGAKWEIAKFGKDGRLATQLRFKVARSAEGLRGVVAHFPCALPAVLKAKLDRDQCRWIEKNERAVWEAIHRSLDSSDHVKRLT